MVLKNVLQKVLQESLLTNFSTLKVNSNLNFYKASNLSAQQYVDFKSGNTVVTLSSSSSTEYFFVFEGNVFKVSFSSYLSNKQSVAIFNFYVSNELKDLTYEQLVPSLKKFNWKTGRRVQHGSSKNFWTYVLSCAVHYSNTSGVRTFSFSGAVDSLTANVRQKTGTQSNLEKELQTTLLRLLLNLHDSEQLVSVATLRSAFTTYVNNLKKELESLKTEVLEGSRVGGPEGEFFEENKNNLVRKYEELLNELSSNNKSKVNSLANFFESYAVSYLKHLEDQESSEVSNFLESFWHTLENLFVKATSYRLYLLLYTFFKKETKGKSTVNYKNFITRALKLLTVAFKAQKFKITKSVFQSFYLKMFEKLTNVAEYFNVQPVTKEQFKLALDNTVRELVSRNSEYLRLHSNYKSRLDYVVSNLDSSYFKNPKSVTKLEFNVFKEVNEFLSEQESEKQFLSQPGCLVEVVPEKLHVFFNSREKLYYKALLSYGVPKSNVTYDGRQLYFTVPKGSLT